jgi:hypothetical protein
MFVQKFPSPFWILTCFAFCACCRVAVSMLKVAQWPSHRAPSMGTQLAMCVLMFKSSHRPDGKIADVLALTLACTTRCLQGGGVYVGFGTVTITSSSITGNTAYGYVRAHVQEFPLSPCHQRQRHRHPASTSSKEVKTSHGPNGKMADVLASTLACTTAADASVNYSMYVLQRP